MKENERIKLVFLTALIVVIADQLTKYFFMVEKPVELIRNFLYIKSVHNTGMAFGMMQDQNMVLIWLTLVFIGIIVYYSDEVAETKQLAILAGLITGGAIGNLIDRIFLGFVRDFIAFSFWPAFNVADAALTIGAIGIVILLLLKKK